MNAHPGSAIGSGTQIAGRVRRRMERPRRSLCSLERLEALDAELASRAREAGRLRFEMGRGLDLLERTGGDHVLGFSSVEAYALERCERSASWTQKARGSARRLEGLPAVADALISGSLNWSMAAVLAAVARPDDADFWLEEAPRRTVREMKALAHERQGTDSTEALEAEEEMRTLTLTVPREDAWCFEQAKLLARHLGDGADGTNAEVVFLADALDRGELGYEAARLVARVATRATVQAWVERARERTVRHLREEIDAAELLARWSESPTVAPPSEADVRRVEELERSVATGQISAPPASLPATTATPAKVTLRLRVRASTASDFRHWEAIYLRHRGATLRNTTFLRFACELFTDTWRPRGLGVEYAHIYERDRHRCQRVCLGSGV